jgi:hypothetical protein
MKFEKNDIIGFIFLAPLVVMLWVLLGCITYSVVVDTF